MDQRRVGRALRVLRRARRLRQADVATAAGVSQSTVSQIELGRWDAMSMRTLCRVFDAVEADIDMGVRYRGGGLDRLLDERHASTASAMSSLLSSRGWTVTPEVSFNHYGDRGSVDLLAFHPPSHVLLVVEVKSEIASTEETLRRLDVKARLGRTIAGGRLGVEPVSVVRLLAIRASSANRDRVARLDPLLGPAFPLRGGRLTGWLRAPTPLEGRLAAGLMFVRDTGRAGRKEGPRPRRRATCGTDPAGRAWTGSRWTSPRG